MASTGKASCAEKRRRSGVRLMRASGRHGHLGEGEAARESGRRRIDQAWWRVVLNICSLDEGIKRGVCNL